MFALGDLSLTIKGGVQHGLWGGAIVNLGTQWHHETFLPDIISCRLPGCFAMTEMGHGSDVMSVETTITYLPATSEFDVHSPTASATKAYIGNAAEHGRAAAVFGQLWVDGTCHGVHTIVVPIRDEAGQAMPGVTLGDHGHKGGLLGVDNGTISFDHVRVPRTHLLNRYGGINEDGVYSSPIANPNARFFTMVGTLVRGRICVAAGAVQATRKALTIATTYGLRRSQFRAPGLGEEILLLDYRAHQRKLLPNIARAYAYGFSINEIAQQLQRLHDVDVPEPRQARELETRAAGLKAVLSRWANDTIQVCREACGGAGYMSDAGITLLRQDTDVFATFEGDNAVLLQLVAKGMLQDYARTWGEMDTVDLARHMARMVGEGFMERTAARTVIDRLVQTAQRTPDAELLTDRGWQVSMFEARERHIVEALARRMRRAKGLGDQEAFDVVNACQPHMLKAGIVHTDRIILEAFIAGIDAVEDPAVKLLLGKLCDLFVLDNLLDDATWFLEHNRMPNSRVNQLRQAVNGLCAELRSHAQLLIDGFGIPRAWIHSTLMGED
ncbi:ABC transporter [Platysternon megacephalum]|uniref:Acyl-coenzyme A oxidase n=1 Tax=Platysternon megacephalum TaxID=55544 RepID=A0A4D9DKF4_9SAUR|nr:ABC transporter [Platysternon megacephalum]